MPVVKLATESPISQNKHHSAYIDSGLKMAQLEFSILIMILYDVCFARQ
jgi:hypothetical protein